MKLASYVKNGKPTFGAETAGGLVTLAGLLPGIDCVVDAIREDRLDDLAAIASRRDGDTSIDGVSFLPAVPNGQKIVCIGHNYHGHAPVEPKEWPDFFIRFPDSLVGHGEPLQRPKVSPSYDFEGELAVVIGREGRHIRREDALSHIAGYTCFLDGSVRDYQARSMAAGKNFRASGAMGPFMLTADEVPDPSRLVLSTTLNGERVQHSGLDQLIHSIPKIISYLSEIMLLQPGDVISTGTPEGLGVSRQPPLWMKPGDRISVQIEPIGILSNPVIAEID